MPSPPPTPSSTAPTHRSGWRFEPLTVATEWVEDYRPGNFHPVDLGHTFKDGRYRVLRKLGHGSFSTVWLAKDELKGIYVALKILTAQVTAIETESTVLKCIAQSSLLHSGKGHILPLLDYFTHRGPNGNHRCLVFDAMGPSTATMVRFLPESLACKTGRRDRYPIWMAKSILRQVLLGIDYLHQIGIGHGDLQPGNILFSTTELATMEEISLSQKDTKPNSLVPIQRQDKKIDLWAPKYLAENMSLKEFARLDSNFIIKISDMGGAFFFDKPPNSLVTPVGLRSPETIVGEVPTRDQDIWSFGCLIFEFLIGRPLFPVDNTGDESDTNDDHLLQFFTVLGKIPMDILSKWPRSDIYFNKDGENVKDYIGELPESHDLRELESEPPLEELFDQEKPIEMNDEEAIQIKHILRWILQYDQSKRPSASDLLGHPWFAGQNII